MLKDERQNIPFQVIRWNNIAKEEHEGEHGTSFWQTVQMPSLRLRIVEYSAGYLSDHWCKKGHIIYCIEGSFVSDLQNGKSFSLCQGMTYIVSDEQSSHRSLSKDGVKLLIIDGEFLNYRLY